jgi:RNA polymerase sigma-70 factor (ECF subfamily)
MIDFAGLYRSHADHVYRFAFYLSGDRSTAEDIVAETFVRVWGARERLDLSTVRAYLLAIARNEFLQMVRRSKRETTLDPGFRDPAPAVDERLGVRDELERVLRALQELPEVVRSAVLLRGEANLSYEDIASALGVSPGAARVMVHRARAKLAAEREESEG